MTLAEVDGLIPSGPAPTYGGSWIGWYLRVLLGAAFGLPFARRIVIAAVGPGHDYLGAADSDEQPARQRVRRGRR